MGGRRRGGCALPARACPKLGKGGVLNAALAEADDEIVVTLDADTRLAPGALASIAATFDDPEVIAAGGFVYVRNACGAEASWLARYQYWEYVKNFMWRIGLAHMGVCLQVSGAFGAFRTRVLREVGGFSGHSLVEDYEVIFRLHERLRAENRPYRVAVAPGAVAYTEAPDTVPSFVHQRTRWFTGFLQTMWDYRRMVGNPRMGGVGFLMLPIKCVDAVLPAWGFLSLAILAGLDLRRQRRNGSGSGWNLFRAWDVELTLSGIMWRWHRRVFPDRKSRSAARSSLLHMATEGLIFNWFRQVAVLNAYNWFLRRVQRWHQPRWVAAGQRRKAEVGTPDSALTAPRLPERLSGPQHERHRSTRPDQSLPHLPQGRRPVGRGQGARQARSTTRSARPAT